ncbi:MAG: P-aminobenzoate N-oxygenase AurF [Halobacteriovoraceae bacterium]|jgi:hypothetical protein|nr:P-aminobenzoate N-oxygenase AurF [Halobacteriovoraceae bacterium]MBT5095679.1 P-aminobenzoate N-oxygenase AurF [Halobacteriovoraceae bacterium]
MNTALGQREEKSLLNDTRTSKRIEINYRRNKEQDNTQILDQLALDFKYEQCNHQLWNPEKYSLMYGTPLWDASSPDQRKLLNHLYWVAYYSQIISAEIATIFFNQTSAAGLYSLEDFRSVCDTLDLESAQERAHTHCFKVIAEQVEEKLFGERLFTYSMKNWASETMIFQDTNYFKEQWKKFQLRTFALLSSSNAFIASQYFTVRGLRTLNGKIVQHQLSEFGKTDNSPIPAKVSYHHFLDESYHFNSSQIIGHDIINSLRAPSKFESTVANLGVRGSLVDHSHFSLTVNGLFWYEPALFPIIYKILKSPYFEYSHSEALMMLRKCYTRENNALHIAAETHQVAIDSYELYLQGLPHIWKSNREIQPMKNFSIQKYLSINSQALKRFEAKIGR